MSLKSLDSKIAKKTLWEQAGDITCSNFPFRDGAKDSTFFGWDIDSGVAEYPNRFHRGTDRAYGTGKIFTPVAFDGGLLSIHAGSDFGTLLRLFYADNNHGWELRIAHINEATDVDKDFIKLVKTVEDKDAQGKFAQYSFDGLSHIPANTRIGRPGNMGISMGAHTHTELISIGGRNVGLDELLEKRDFFPGHVYKIKSPAFDYYLKSAFLAKMKRNITDQEYAQVLNYLVKQRGYTAVGPYEAHGFDDRTNQNCIWYSTRATLNI